ncbi:MAG: hypothetical protein JWQ57_787, partial [Mucilaginibacter sp.]|nr:hypothetical protein [Mucilaginibacter sp.]
SVTRYEVYRRLKIAKNPLIEFYDEFPVTAGVVYNMGYEHLKERDHEFMIQESLRNCLNDALKYSDEQNPTPK